MTTIEQQAVREYRRRLARQGIPFDPAERTSDQQATATAEAWATKLPFSAIAILNLDAPEGDE